MLRKTCFTTSLSLAVLIFLTFLAASCNRRHNRPGRAGFADESFADRLSSLLPSPDTTLQVKRSLVNDVRLVYALDDYQPIWIDERYRASKAANRLIEELDDMLWDGIDPESLSLDEMKALREKLDTTKKNTLEDAIRFDTLLTQKYLTAAKFLLFGHILPRKADSLWYHSNDSTWNGPERLVNAEGEFPSLMEFRSEWPTYALLRNEYRRYYILQDDSSYLNAKFNLQQSGQMDEVTRVSADYIIQAEMPWLEIVHSDTISDRAQLIQAYQNYHSLKVTRKLDDETLATLAATPETTLKQLAANMERLRWMKQKPGDLYIVVDVPLMELYFRKDAVNVMHKRVVVGRTIRQTPSLNADMKHIVVNPPWGVPPTILKKDVLPGIQKDGKEYLAKKGLKIYDKKGNAVSVREVNARNYRTFSYRQAPGDDNSLGYVKFNMPNKWDIYLHDTPHREDFGKKDRALSSGCVRVHEPQEMALYIMNAIEGREEFTQGKLDTMIQTHKTKWESLKTHIPVYITYLTIFEDSTNNHIIFARDIYGRDAKLMAMMK